MSALQENILSSNKKAIENQTESGQAKLFMACLLALIFVGGTGGYVYFGTTYSDAVIVEDEPHTQKETTEKMLTKTESKPAELLPVNDNGGVKASLSLSKKNEPEQVLDDENIEKRLPEENTNRVVGHREKENQIKGDAGSRENKKVVSQTKATKKSSTKNPVYKPKQKKAEKAQTDFVEPLVVRSNRRPIGRSQAGLFALEEGRYEEAIDVFQPMAERGSLRANFYIGYLTILGLGVPKNEELGMSMLLEAKDNVISSAYEGQVWAHTCLGLMYESGWGVEKDLDQAVSWHEKAAQQDMVISLNSLQNIYQSTDFSGTDLDKTVAYQNQMNSILNP